MQWGCKQKGRFWSCQVLWQLSASGLRHESCRSWEPASFADLYGDGLFQCVQVQASLYVIAIMASLCTSLDVLSFRLRISLEAVPETVFSIECHFGVRFSCSTSSTPNGRQTCKRVGKAHVSKCFPNILYSVCGLSLSSPRHWECKSSSQGPKIYFYDLFYLARRKVMLERSWMSYPTSFDLWSCLPMLQKWHHPYFFMQGWQWQCWCG